MAPKQNYDTPFQAKASRSVIPRQKAFQHDARHSIANNLQQSAGRGPRRPLRLTSPLLILKVLDYCTRLLLNRVVDQKLLAYCLRGVTLRFV